MDFKWLNKQGVESSTGFVFQSADRWGYTYTEGVHSLRVCLEPGNDSVGYLERIDLNSFLAWLAPEKTELPPSEQERIRGNVAKALEFMSIRAEFIEP